MASIMRVRWLITGLTGLPGVHTTYWTGASSTPVQADATDVSGRVRAFWDGFKTVLAAGVTVSTAASVEVLDVATGTLVGQLGPGSQTSVVSTGANELPAATMMLLKLSTATVLNGRRLQGRSFIGPLGTGANTNGKVTPASNTTLLTASNALFTGATSSALVVWHRPDRVTHLGGVVAPVTVAGTAIDFAVLRSRRD